jgi:hypothetical protein
MRQNVMAINPTDRRCATIHFKASGPSPHSAPGIQSTQRSSARRRRIGETGVGDERGPRNTESWNERYEMRKVDLKRLFLTGIAALLIATSAAHARPELSKTQSWKLILGAWCVGDHPSDNKAYSGIRRDKCGENEETLIIGENGYVGNMRMSCAVDTHPARLVLTTTLLHQPKQLGCGFSILMRVV